MIKTERLGLYLPEGGDPLSVGPLNENFQRLDGVMRVAQGSYSGVVPAGEPRSCYDYAGRKHTCGFGQPESGAADVSIALEFEPKLFLLTGCRETETVWEQVTTGTITTEGSISSTDEYSGMEYQLFSMAAAAGQSLCRGQLSCRYPFVGANEYGDYVFAWQEEHGPVFCRVETAVNEDGTCTLSVLGTDEAYGSVNYANVEGMTYRWTAIG